MDADVFLTEDEARRLYHNGDAAHDFDHVLRVAETAVRIAGAEGADVTVVRLAALLHDAPGAADDGVRMTSGRGGHHLAAAERAGALLSARGLGTAQTANVVHCIEAHRYRDRSIQPQTLEAKCVYDADKLDSIGATGIARVFAYAGAHGNRLWTTPHSEITDGGDARLGDAYTPVHEYVCKLRHILGGLYTETARRIGRERHAYMTAFFAQLDAEMAGRA